MDVWYWNRQDFGITSSSWKEKEKKKKRKNEKTKGKKKLTLTSTPLINNSKILSLETLEAAPLGIGHASTLSLVHKFKN